MHGRTWRRALGVAIVAIAAIAGTARSVKAEELCDPAFENCRSRLITLIRNETVGIDVAFWFMEDQRYMTEIIARWRAGVPVRLIVDPRATTSGYPANGPVLDGFRAAGIPMRMRTAPGILHWKMMLFAGQGVVEFSGANFSPNAFLPTVPYANYVDEAIYFCDDMSIVQSFMTKYDDLWLDTTKYADYANLILPRARVYPVFPKNPELNFPETEDYSNRATGRYGRETQRIDAIMYRITDERHTNAIIAAQARGVAVRLISDTYEYRKTTRLWHSYNLDRLYAAGIPIRVRAHEGLNHQKSVILYGLGMTIFGSSNWTSPSSNSQQEHNLFTTKPWIFQWFVDQFERKWNNTNPDAVIETQPFVPLPPDKPVVKSPATGAVNVATTGQRLKWYGGPWAHIYDIYFGLDPNPPLYAENQRLGPSETTTQVQSLLLPTLQPGTTYYWKVVAKTMAGKTAAGPVWKFTTAGVPPTPPPAPTDASTVTIWASDVPPASLVGMWQFVSDPTAVGGTALLNPDKGKATVTPALAAPANYFDVEFDAMAGVPYHLWIRMRSYNNSTSNDSVSVQFSDSLDHLGTPVYRIGSPSGAEVILRDGAAGTLSGWGWADNGYGVVGPDVYFATTGRHTLRVQTRADGAVIDQIVLSPHAFIRSAPGSGKNDQSMYASTVSGATPQPTNIEMPWQIATLGTVGINGIVRRDVATSVYSMYAGGGDIWGTSDGMLFMHQPLSGDGTLVVRVASAVQNTNPLARVGLMIRESLDPGARNAFMFYSAGKTTALQRRHESGGTTIATGGPVNIVAPYWLRLERAGNLFTGYVSKDGVTWTYVASDVVAMPTDVYVGLAGASVNMLTTTAATLDNLTVQPGPPVPPTGPPSLPPLPAGWTNQDIGQVGYTGEASFASSTSSFSIKGAGADIGGGTDGLHFVYRALTGDGTIVARVKTQQNTNADAKAGVMIRESLAPDAANAFMAVTPVKGNKFQRRGGGGAATTVTAGALVKAPYWVKLERLGQTVNAYESADGATWTLVGSDFIGWPETVWIGLAVTSRTMTATSTVTFDSVSVQ